MNKTESLITFNNPPVTETVLSVQFNNLSNFAVPYFGLYWDRIREKYKSQPETKYPLDSVFEDFSSNSQTNLPIQQILKDQRPDVRCWFKTEAGDKIIQVQSNRFVHNWRKTNEKPEYPRYSEMRKSFTDEWNTFLSFLKDEKVETPLINQCEVTYVNHIEFEEGNALKFDMSSLKIWSNDESLGNLRTPILADINLIYHMLEGPGRVYIKIFPGIRHQDSKKIMVINLTARGQSKDNELNSILDWFDIGRKNIVNIFNKITSEKYHKIWNKEE